VVGFGAEKCQEKVTDPFSESICPFLIFKMNRTRLLFLLAQRVLNEFS
jgi:hypothetical protein